MVFLEGRGTISAAGDPVALTDPTPVQLSNVAEQWNLALEPTAGPGRDT
ncbi:hypothetical protein [Mycolicibacterium xanthum]|nr:hypothetical protein [Mycolicibacterium xanthum]